MTESQSVRVKQIGLGAEIERETTWHRARYALHEWRPCYRFVSHHLTMCKDDTDNDALGYLSATIAWDEAHRVRYRLWRIYINLTQPTDLVKDHITRPLIRFWQRGRRGWCYEDVWSVDAWLARTLPPMLDQLRKENHGWPGEPMTFDEWNGDDGIVAQIAEGFRAARLIEDSGYGCESEPTYEELHAKFDAGFDLFREWYFQLWD